MDTGKGDVRDKLAASRDATGASSALPGAAGGVSLRTPSPDSSPNLSDSSSGSWAGVGRPADAGDPQPERPRREFDELATRELGTGSDATVVGTGGLTGESLVGMSTRLPTVDGYDVVRCIGHGGMGVVYECVQQATGRHVAIKFLLELSGGSESARHRFEREVEVVARLQHPGIVRIIDSGVRKGRYFYVMDFVSGKPLDEVLLPGKGAIDKILHAVIEVCEAVDYAHQRGVLHRDLKPSNVLMDAEGHCHLLDFGVAKEMSSTKEQRTITVAGEGQLIGTVAYMSPEQASGKAEEASLRSDVYSLGVIAYELLAGDLPIQCSGALRDVLTAIAEHDPKPPSSLRPAISRDLDAVLLRALEKAPERRYATAGEFAADLRRILAGEPVTARRLSPIGRGWRWVKRHSAISATVAAAAAILVITSAALVYRIVQERDRANENAAQTQKNYELAKNNFMLLRDVIEAADPDRSGEITVADMLDSATRRLDSVPPESKPTEAAVREIIGSVYRKLARYDKAEATLRRALEIREHQNPPEKPALAECIHNLAATLYWKGNFTEAKGYYERSLALRREMYPGDHRDVAMSLTHLAACELEIGSADVAHQLYSDALDMRVRLLGSEHEEVAQSMNNLAKSYLEDEQFGRAQDLFERSLAMITRLRGEQYVGTAAVSQNMAKCLLDKGDYAAAIEAYARALTIRRARFPKGHPSIAATLSGSARASLALGQVDRAIELAAEAVQMCVQLKQEQLPEAGDARATLGSALLSAGRVAEAVTELRVAHDVLANVRPPSRQQFAAVELELAVATRLRSKSLSEAGRVSADSDEATEAQIRAAFSELVATHPPGSVVLERQRARLISLGVPAAFLDAATPAPRRPTGTTN